MGKRVSLKWKFLICAWILAPVLATAQDGNVVELRETIAKIVDVKAQASKEESDWLGRKEEMSELLKVHRRELELLDEELAKSGTSAGGYGEKESAAKEELEKLRQARRLAGEAVVRNRDRMMALASLFPRPLAEEAKPELLSLADWESGDEAREGLQAILGMVTKAERFNRRITRAKEERDGREVDVIYLGLARAYYADGGGVAGVGFPAKGGWQWTSMPQLNSEIVKALDVLDRKRPPEFVELPAKIENIGE